MGTGFWDQEVMGLTGLIERTGAVVLLVCWVIISACAHKPDRDALVDYVNDDIIRISELETMSLFRYGYVTGENYKGDEVLLSQLNSYVIPQYERFTELLRDCRPRTEDLQKLHSTYVRGAATLLEGFKLLAIAVEHQDLDLVRHANGKIVHGREMLDAWREELMELAAKHKVKLQTEEDKKKKRSFRSLFFS
jgi:hypothetical protein